MSYVVSTTYLDWSTEFPSVSVCESQNNKKSMLLAVQYFGPGRDIFDKMELMNEIAYTLKRVPMSIPYLQKICKGKKKKNKPPVNCTGIDIVSAARMIRSACNETFESCRWNGEEFDCCEYFLQLETELGICYSVNSLQATREGTTFINLMSNSSNGPGTLHLQLRTSANVYIHEQSDVPNANPVETDMMKVETRPGECHEISLTFQETENTLGVEDINYRKRKCKFNWENEDSAFYRFYSYSTCVVECRLRAEFKLCNCTTHLLINENSKNGRVCEVDDLFCLKNNFEFLSNLGASWSSDDRSLKCPCYPGCSEVEIGEIMSRKLVFSNETKSQIQLKLHSLPTEKFSRTVVRSKLDLVVSMGSAAGLFVGASLLSFVEIIYYFTLRLCFKRRSSNSRHTILTRNTRIPVLVQSRKRRILALKSLNEELTIKRMKVPTFTKNYDFIGDNIFQRQVVLK